MPRPYHCTLNNLQPIDIHSYSRIVQPYATDLHGSCDRWLTVTRYRWNCNNDWGLSSAGTDTCCPVDDPVHHLAGRRIADSVVPLVIAGQFFKRDTHQALQKQGLRRIQRVD